MHHTIHHPNAAKIPKAGTFLPQVWNRSSAHGAVLHWDLMHPPKYLCTAFTLKQLQLTQATPEFASDPQCRSTWRTSRHFSVDRCSLAWLLSHYLDYFLVWGFFRSWILLNSVFWKSSNTSGFFPDEMLWSGLAVTYSIVIITLTCRWGVKIY